MKKIFTFLLMILIFKSQAQTQQQYILQQDLNYKSGLDPTIYDIADDGSIYRINTYGSDNKLYKHLPNGQIDQSFGGSGSVKVNFLNFIKVAYSKIYISGYNNNGGYSGIARYNLDGSLDTSFGENGVVKNTYLKDLLVNSDGSFLVLSSTDISKYLSNGQLDSSFSTITRNDVSNYQILKFSDNSFLYMEYMNGSYNIKKYISNGNLDNSFGDNANLVFTNASRFNIDKLDNIYYFLKVESGDDFAIKKLLNNGSPDLSYGTDGSVAMSYREFLSIYDHNPYFYDVSINFDSQSNLLLFINRKSGANSSTSHIIARLGQVGNRDSSFNKGKYFGELAYEFSPNSPQPLNKIKIVSENEYLVGMTAVYPETRIQVVKYIRKLEDLSVVENVKNNLLVFPNPTQDFLSIKLPNTESVEAIRIMSLEGKLVRVSKAAEKIDVSNLPIGNYFIEVKTETQIFKTKFMKK